VAIIKESINSKTLNLIEKVEIKFMCPTCKATKVLEFPSSLINGTKQLTTISLPKGLICPHHFQAFVDKNFMVRGYQKVDFEFKFESNNKSNLLNLIQDKEEQDLFNELILEGNYVKYTPKMQNQEKVLKDSNQNIREKISSENFTLKKIYDEFWEIIDDNNITFKKFIDADTRRKKKILF
jgi:hypothetical protein